MKDLRLKILAIIYLSLLGLPIYAQGVLNKGDVIISSYISLFPHDLSANIGYKFSPENADKTGLPFLLGLKGEFVQ